MHMSMQGPLSVRHAALLVTGHQIHVAPSGVKISLGPVLDMCCQTSFSRSSVS